MCLDGDKHIGIKILVKYDRCAALTHIFLFFYFPLFSGESMRLASASVYVLLGHKQVLSVGLAVAGARALPVSSNPPAALSGKKP
jgi:hypothetical protein